MLCSPSLTTRGAFISNSERVALSDSTAGLYHPSPSRYDSVPRIVEDWSATDDLVGTAEDCTTSAWTLLPRAPRYRDLPQGSTSSLSNALSSEDEAQPLLHSFPTTPAMSQDALPSSSPETPYLPLGSSSPPPTALCSPARTFPTLSHTEDETQFVPPGTRSTLPSTPATPALFLPQESVLHGTLTTLAIPVLPSTSKASRLLLLEPPSSLSAARASPKLSSPTPSHTEDDTQLMVPDTTLLTPAIRPGYSSRPRRYHSCILSSVPRVASPISSLSVHNGYFAPPSASTALPLIPPPLASPSETRSKATSKSGLERKRHTHTKLTSSTKFYSPKSAHSTARREIPIVTGKISVAKQRAAARGASPSSHSETHKQHLCHRGCGYSTDLRGDVVRHDKRCRGGRKEYFCIGKPVDEIPDSESIVEAVEWPGAENMLFAKGCGKSFSRKDAYERHLRNPKNSGCVGDLDGAWWANEKVKNALAVTEYVASFALLFAAHADDCHRYQPIQNARRR